MWLDAHLAALDGRPVWPSFNTPKYNLPMTFFLSARARVLPALAAAAVLCAGALHAQETGRGRKYKPPPPVSKITVTVVRATDGKPLPKAAVIFHTFHEGKDLGNMELKTNEDGQATINVIPVGDQVQLQVFKSGFQTFGENFVNDQESRDLMVKVKRPSGQFSVYQRTPVDSTQQQSVTPQPTEGADKAPAKPH